MTTNPKKLTNVLQTLSLELPDPQQELSVQILEPKLDIFTLFPNLPTEIRLAIWRLAFPGRREVSFMPVSDDHYDDSGLERMNATSRIPHLPLTLYINQESRQETLRHYCRLVQDQRWNDDKINGGGPPRIVCLDPKVDRVWFDLETLCYSPKDPDGLIPKLCQQASRGFEPIRILEIRDFMFSKLVRILCGNIGYDIKTAQECLLYHFPKLEQLHLIGIKKCSLFRLRDERLEEASYGYYKLLKGVLQKWQKWDPERTVPQIYFHDYRRRTSRSDYELIWDARIPYP